MPMKSCAPLGLAVVSCVLSSFAWGITGSVTAPDSSPIPGATVGLLSADNELLATATTAADGSFDVAGTAANGFLTITPPRSIGADGYDRLFHMPRTYALGANTVVNAVLPPVGALVLEGYDSSGQLLRWDDYEARGMLGGQFMFLTDLDRVAAPAAYFAVHDAASRAPGAAESGLPALLFEAGPARVVQVMYWESSYGKLLLEADNGGEGFRIDTPGQTLVLELNVEFARTAVSQLDANRARYDSGAGAEIDTLLSALDQAIVLPTAPQRAAAADQVLHNALQLRDALEYASAVAAIPSVREGTVTVTVRNAQNNPVNNATVELIQQRHDFRFGAYHGGATLDMAAWQAARDAGFELATRLIAWGFVEQSDGTMLEPALIDQALGFTALRNMGFDLKAHGVVYLQDAYGILPDRALTMPWQDVYQGLLDHEASLLSNFGGDIAVWEAMNEMAQTNGVGMPLADVMNLMADSASAIVATPGAEPLVNSVHELNYGKRYRYYDVDNDIYDSEQALSTYTEFLANAEAAGALADVDAVGLQFYPGVRLGDDFSAVEGPCFTPSHGAELATRFHAFDRPIGITEFSIPSTYGPTWHSGYWREPWTETTQADYTDMYLTMLFANPRVESFTWWDLTDDRSSLLSGGIIDATGRKKPVYYALQDLISSWTTHRSALTVSGVATLSGIGGQYELRVTLSGGQTITRDIYLCERQQSALIVRTNQATGNIPPVAKDRWIHTTKATPVSAYLVGTDGNPDVLSYSITTAPAHGTLSGSGPNRTYTPTAAYVGDDWFGYQISDNNGGTVTGHVYIDVRPAANIAPVAAFNYTVTQRQVAFTDTSTDPDGSVVAYAWNFGDGTTSTVQHPVHDYVGDGQYGVTLTVTDSQGGQTSTSRVLRVAMTDSPPTADFSFVIDGNQVSFTDLSSDLDGVVTYRQWSFGDASAPSNETNPVHTYPGPGWYTVTLFVSDDDGDSATKTSGVVVNSPPIAVFTASVSGSQITCTDYSWDPNDSVAAWLWDFGDGQTSAAQHPTHTYGAYGTYLVRLTVTDTEGATGTATQSVTIEPPNIAPTAGFSYTVTDHLVQATDASTDANGSLIFWYWDFGDGSAPSTAQNPSHTYATSGTYVLFLFVMDNDGASAFTYELVTIAPPPNVAPTAAIDATVNGNTVTFHDASTDTDGNIAFWYWAFGDGTPASNVANPVHTYANPGTYYVYLFVADDRGGSDIATTTVTINSPPVAAFGFSVAGNTATFTDYSWDANGPVTAWQWNFGDGTTSTQRNPVHTYAGPGNYTVTLTAYDPEGATNQASKIVSIAAPNVAPVANFTYSRTARTITFTDTSTDSDGTVVYWYWVFGDGTPAATTRNTSHTYASAGTYTVTLYVYDDDGAMHSKQQTIVVP